jgi:hypothetical protein
LSNLDDMELELRSKGWKEDNKHEIPPGSCCIFRDPAENCIAIYENQRKYVMEEYNAKL